MTGFVVFLMGSAFATFAMSMCWIAQLEYKRSEEVQTAIATTSAIFGFIMFFIGLLMLTK